MRTYGTSDIEDEMSHFELPPPAEMKLFDDENKVLCDNTGIDLVQPPTDNSRSELRMVDRDMEEESEGTVGGTGSEADGYFGSAPDPCVESVDSPLQPTSIMHLPSTLKSRDVLGVRGASLLVSTLVLLSLILTADARALLRRRQARNEPLNATSLAGIVKQKAYKAGTKATFTWWGGPIIEKPEVTVIYYGANVRFQNEMTDYYKFIVDSPHMDWCK
ncbi:hypothetical protein HDV05_001420 [Chytridiales sp. JEL 0842]|nr:hypothetical protein HDV05_001420 [Chytridiales sp. JEL 0842]